jgi:hypothetical protein
MRFKWRSVSKRRNREPAGLPPANSRIVIIALFGRWDTEPRQLSKRLRSTGATVCVTHGSDGCLRVATATRPAAIYLDHRLPTSLDRLLQGHPATASSRILEFSGGEQLSPSRRRP